MAIETQLYTRRLGNTRVSPNSTEMVAAGGRSEIVAGDKRFGLSFKADAL